MLQQSAAGRAEKIYFILSNCLCGVGRRACISWGEGSTQTATQTLKIAPSFCAYCFVNSFLVQCGCSGCQRTDAVPMRGVRPAYPSTVCFVCRAATCNTCVSSCEGVTWNLVVTVTFFAPIVTCSFTINGCWICMNMTSNVLFYMFFSQHIFVLFHVWHRCEPYLTIWSLQIFTSVIRSIVE